MMTDFDVSCPYCGEIFNTLIDYSALLTDNNIDASNSQDYTYTEDCQVCCQPILFTPVLNSKGELENVITRSEYE